jgi:hypothetical protein
MEDYFKDLKQMNSKYIDKKVFLNIDEIPIPFDLSSDYTYELKGKKEISVTTHGQNKVRMSLLAAISSNGDVLPPMLVFIYKYSGKGT